MHLREVLAAGGGTLTDSMHLVFAMVTVLVMLLAMGLGARAFGQTFRVYSVATIVILAACGAFTTLDAPRVGANLPTPWVGVWERIDIGVFLLWVVVLAVTLLRDNPCREAIADSQEHPPSFESRDSDGHQAECVPERRGTTGALTERGTSHHHGAAHGHAGLGSREPKNQALVASVAAR
jgi:hypothetical protein